MRLEPTTRRIQSISAGKILEYTRAGSCLTPQHIRPNIFVPSERHTHYLLIIIFYQGAQCPKPRRRDDRKRGETLESVWQIRQSTTMGELILINRYLALLLLMFAPSISSLRDPLLIEYL